MADHEPTICIARCAVRNPKRRKPGDYFIIVVNASANPGNLPGLFPVMEHSGSPNWGECDLGYFWKSCAVEPSELPAELLAGLHGVEPQGPIVWRKRLSRRDRDAMWNRS